jgi:hypothetical protein
MDIAPWQGFNPGAVAGRHGWRFAQLSIRAHSGLVYRLVALSSIMAAPEGSAWADGCCGWGSSAKVRRPGKSHGGCGG